MRHRLLFALLLCTLAMPVFAQPEGVLQLNDPLHRFLERQQTRGRLPGSFLSHKPLSAYEARRYLDSLDVSQLGHLDQQLYARFTGEVVGPGVETYRKVIPFIYRNGNDFFSARDEDYAILINPLAYLQVGRATQTEMDGRESSVTTWQNTRGARASGHIGKHIFFETRLEENQRRVLRPDFQERITAPRLGGTKLIGEDDTYDYFVATGLVGFRSKFFEVRFGRDRNRWGTALGSLLLSNYASPYDQLQIRTTVWRFQYTNLFTGRSYPSSAAIEERFTPRRYGAFHHLAIDLPGRIQAELFEAITFASSDTTGLRDSGFDLTYLNPIIFLRAVETDRGSPDNALIGGGLSWIAFPGLKIYTQFIIDELDISRIGDKNWGNKWGFLGGLHLADLPISNTSLRLEYARLRPYLYAHRDRSTAYLHYNDVLGHPAGPNAQDVTMVLDVQPVHRVRGTFFLSYTQRGRNTEMGNFGSDPLLSTDTRVRSNDVTLLQGVRQNVVLFEGHVGFEVLPDAFIELALRSESVDDEERGLDRYLIPSVLFRWGLPYQSVRY